MFLPLPDNDDALIPRSDVQKFGGPAPATLAKWACMPSEAPCEIPYVLVGRRAAYRVGDLRRLRAMLTFRNTTERTLRNQQHERAEAATEAFDVRRQSAGTDDIQNEETDTK